MTQQDYIALVDRAKRLSYEYYVLAQPSVSDAQFDALVTEIEQAEAEHPEWVLADSPTQQVGSDLQDNGRRLIRHRTRMLSCQKAQTQEAVTKWLSKVNKALKGIGVTYALEWKYDGISCSLVYQDGVLVSAATRGDKDKGQDLLAHVTMIPSVPQRINMTGRVEVRGEIVCPKSALVRLGYKDCRTAAAALTNAMVPTDDMKHLVFIAWQMDSDDQPFGTESVSLIAAQEHGFLCDVRTCDGKDVLSLLDDYAAEREALTYPTDGVVIKIDQKQVSASLGCTEHHPNGNIAYKFSAQKTTTRVLRIEVSVGATGKRTPVAYLEPVMIMGREVKQASLYSEKKMAELGVAEGCMVEVGLSNDVTPKVYRVVGGSNEKFLDALAPRRDCSRGTKLKIQNSKLEEEVTMQVEDEQPLPAEEEKPEPLPVKEAVQEPVEEEVPKPKKARAKRKAKHHLETAAEPQPTETEHPAQSNSNGHNFLKAIGSVAAMTIALLVIWQTGLLIPLGLIGLAMSGLIK